MSKKQSNATRQANAQRAAERAAAIRREQQRAEKRRRAFTLGAVVVGVLAVIGALIFVTVSMSGGAGEGEGQVQGAPSGVVNDYALVRGDEAAPVTVEIYEDFMCPFCGQFEAASTEMLGEYADAGDVQVHYRMVAWLDRFSNGTDYSTRAMNAVGVVLDEAGREEALTLHDLLFANQPAEGTEGLSDEQLIDLAVEAGADRDAVAEPIENLKFEKWTVDASEQASQEGFNSTPSVVVNGEQLEFQTIDDLLASLQAAIEAELGS